MSQNLAKADWRPEKISGLANSSSMASSRDWITSGKVKFFQITAIAKTLKIVLSALLITKHGGLDVRDQSRARSRTSIVLRLTFENGRDYPSRRDRLLFYLGRDF
jgi:hypothetical protein